MLVLSLLLACGARAQAPSAVSASSAPAVSGAEAPAPSQAASTASGLVPPAAPADAAEPGVLVPVSTAAAAPGATPPAPPASAQSSGERPVPESPVLPAVPPPAGGRKRIPAEVEEAAQPLTLPPDFKPVRGVHLSSWVAGAPRARRRFLDQLAGTFLNAVVVPMKETDGFVYIPGVAKAAEYRTLVKVIGDPQGLAADIHSRGLKAVARIVVFKDNMLARRRPEWAVRRPDGALWRNKKGITWVDPYRREIWEYNLDIALAAVKAGFDEIQFDYVRFPSDGNTRLCRYSRKDHSERTAVESIREFLRYARARLASAKVPMSIAVFGMTTTAQDDMGIGQDLKGMTELSDYVSPMMYPSHYGHGEYGLRNPNREPYKVIFRGLRDAKKRLGAGSWKLRPYLQDFSLGRPRYGPFEVQAQLLAAQKQGVESFLLWNPANHYTWSALRLRNDSALRYGRAAAGER